MNQNKRKNKILSLAGISKTAFIAGMALLSLGGGSSQAQTNGIWTTPNAGNWSLGTNWSSGAIADGAGSIADFSQTNIGAARVVTIDTTPRTVGTLLIGDSTSSFFGYTIAASGGATLTFNNNGSTALLTQAVNSGANTISAPIILADNLSVTNNHATSLLTISGGITGAKDLALNANNAGGITLSTGSINNGGTITNTGSGTGTSTISSVIGTNVTGVVQDSATSQLLLSGGNTFSSGVTIKKGTVALGGNVAALGTGAVTIGDSAGGSNAATLIGNNSLTYGNAIVLASTTTGTLTIGSATTAGVVFSGGVTGNNNLVIAAGGTNSTINFSTVAVNNAGTITNSGTSTGTVTLSGGVGSNVTAINQNSTTSATAITGALAVNSGGTTLTNTSGVRALSVSGAVGGTGNLILNNNSSLAAGLTLAAINNVGTVTNSGTGTGTSSVTGIIGTNVTGVVQDSAASQLFLNAANTYSSGTVIKKGSLLTGNDAALGTGTVLLGDTSGSADATLLVNSNTLANNITVQSGSAGTLSIGSNGSAAARPAGNILLNNNLTLTVDTGGSGGRSSGAYLATSGTISGTGNLNLNVSGNLTTANDGGASQIDSLNVTGPVTTSGSINNIGTGTGRALISGNISNINSLNQNSATSMLSLTGTNTYSGATNVNAGVLRSTSAGGLSVNSAVTVASGAALQIQNTQSTTQTLTISGHGTSYSDGALSSINVAAYAGAVVLAADSSISSTLANTTLTLSGGVTGSGRTLSTSGVGSITISGNIATGSGGLIKEGRGNLTLSGSNTFSGLTQINNGAILLSSSGALGGGGDISFDGGSLRHSATNVLDYSSRIVNSSGSVAIDTNNSNVTYAGNINDTNTGGLTKLGTAMLTLSGTNTYSGITAINNGGLAISSLSAVSSGPIFIDAGGVLNGNGAYATAQAWLNSGKISTDSTGVLALMDNSNVDLTGYANLMLGTSTGGNTTYTGTITPAGGLYRLGGTTSNTSLTLSNLNALTGSNGLIVGARNGASASGGSVILSNSNNLTGSTTVNSGTLSLAAAGTIAGSAVTVNPGATLAITSGTGGSSVTRASSVTLNRGTLTVTGNSTANSIDEITGALTIGSGGHSTFTISANAARNARVNVGSYARNAGGTAVIRGQDFGVSSLGTPVNGDTNLNFTAPNLVGNGGTGTDRSIFVGVVGDISATGNGFGATGGLLTQDATNGVRRLSGADYKTSITDGQTALDNVQLTSTGTTATTTLANATTINSLSLNSTTATGANVQVTGAGTLTLNSGVIYANSVTATTASGISNAIDFNGREGVVLLGGSSELTLSGVLSNTGGNGLTVYAPGRTLTLSGASANTYTGTTTVNGGTLALNKTAGIDAITGNLIVNTGATLSMSASNQIADTANVTINGGSITYRNETVNDFTMMGGSTNTPQNTNGVILNVNGDLSLSGGASMNNSVAGQINVAGATNLSDGGVLTLLRSQNVLGNYDSVVTLGGGLNITNTTSGDYTAISIGHGSGLGQSGGKLILDGDVTFTGNSTNTNTVLIDAIKGSGRQGIIELTGASPGNRTFNVGNGAANVDLAITAPLVDGSGGASGLIKSGAGTLALSGDSTYTGATSVSNGTLLVNGSLNSAVTVNTGASLGGSGTFNGSVTFASGSTHSPGNSPGLPNYEAGLTYSTGSDFNFELTADTTTGRGTLYDGVNVNGGLLTIQTGVDFNLAFNGTGSTVDFTDSFWDSNQSWLVFDNANSPSVVAGIFSLGTISSDSNAVAFSSTGGSFSFSQTGNDIYLNYSATIPEPSTYAMFGLGLGALWLLRRKNSRRA